MRRYERSYRALAISLACLAGFVDAIGFLNLGGFFVSFMSGNSTRLAVETARGGWAAVGLAGSIVLAFVLGVVAASVLRRLVANKPMTHVTEFVALMMFVATAFTISGFDRPSIFCMTFAMGAANVVFERDGEVSIGVTYVTGALVKLGQHFTAALFGGDRTAWIWQALLWLGLIVGAVLGSVSYRAFGLEALWIASLFAAAIALATRWLETRRVPRARLT